MKTQKRYKKTFNLKHNDEMVQSTLFPKSKKSEEWYITTPKFEKLREKLLKKKNAK